MKVMNPNREVNEPDTFQYDEWRGQFTNYVLRALSLLGIFLLVAVLPIASPIEKIGYTLLYIALLGITFVPFPRRIKASVVPVIGYLLGLYNILDSGPWSDATLFFLASVAFAALLFSRRIYRFFLVLCTGTLFIVAIINSVKLNSVELFKFLSPETPVTGISDWSLYIASFIVIGLGITWAIDLFKKEFRVVVGQHKSALELLAKDKIELEQRVEERTADLTKKTEQLRAASYIARRTSEAQDITALLNVVVNLITSQFGYYHAGIFLVNESGEEAFLQTASSEGGKQMILRSHSLSAGSQSIVGYVMAQKKLRIALDVGTDAVFFNNPDLPMTRSEVALPLMIRNKVLGVLDIQSDQPQAFHAEEVDTLQTLADQVAVAIENGRLLSESQAAIKQLETVATVRTREAWSKKLDDQKHAFTYTPLGMRAEASFNEADENRLKTSIVLRGQEIGSLSLAKKDNTNWSKVDEEMIREVAYQVGLAVDNLRLLEDAQQRARQEQTIGRIASRFSQSLDIDGLLQTAARELGQMSDVSEVSVYIGQLPEQAPQKKRTKRATG